MPQLWVVPEELESAASSLYAYEACKTASYVLWAFSGRRYSGTRTVTERYECPCNSVDTKVPYSVYPELDGLGNVSNVTTGCGCSGTVNGRHIRLRLRGTPVRSVQQVKIGSTILDPSEYKVVNSSLLQLNGASSDICNLEITYTYGVNVPVAGRRAARMLASELVLGWSGSGDCRLPDRATSINRQGLSIEILDPQDFLNEGRTGVYEVDLFLRAANPDMARKPARVFSPDLPKAYRVTAGQTTQIMGPYDWQITPGQADSWSVNISEIGADALNSGWSAQGQISMWNGAILLEFDSSRFQIVGETLTVNLTASETAQIQGSVASWDLYGINDTDGFTIMHFLNSNIYMTGN